jgi:hypothetical protein
MMTEVMLLQELIATTNIFGDGEQGCIEGEISSRSDFGLDLRPVFHLSQIEAEEKTEDTGDGAFGEERGENRFWAVATPLVRLGRRPTPMAPGVATAQRFQQNSSLRRRKNSYRKGNPFES